MADDGGASSDQVRHNHHTPGIITYPTDYIQATTPLLAANGSANQLDHLRVAPGVAPTDLDALKPLIDRSPFLDIRHPFTIYEWFKVILLLPWTLFRLMLFVVIGPFVTLHVWLLIRGAPRDAPLDPITMRRVHAIIRFWGNILLRLGCHFWNVPVRGREHMATAQHVRSVLVYNHISWIDPLVLVVLFMPSGVAKAGVANLPLFGTMARALRFVFVERKGMDRQATEGSGRQRIAQSVSSGGAALVAARAPDPRYPLVMIAPEGTTKAASCLLRFSSGSFVSGAPVTPILLRYTARHFHPGWGRYPILVHMLRLFSQFANHLEVRRRLFFWSMRICVCYRWRCCRRTYRVLRKRRRQRCMQPMCVPQWQRRLGGRRSTRGLRSWWR